MAILSIEKTTAAILEKFRNLSEFETRKIVFWYDGEQTAGEEDLTHIREALTEQGIRMHILNGNSFATKKLLEHEDITSSYLIYSAKPEPDYEKNWLLDIQLYSERFENSRISDIKAEIGIEGYDLDPFLGANQKFFSNKRRALGFKKFYEPAWREEDCIRGILAVLSNASAPDVREIAKSVLMDSLREEENTLWEQIAKFDLTVRFWEIVRKQFGYYQESPTLKKLFLSLLITHIDRHATLSLGHLEQFVNTKRQGNECELFISGWMHHARDSARFDSYCTDLLMEQDKKLEKELTSIVNNERIEGYLNPEAPDIFDKSIIRKIVSTLSDGGQDYDKYLSWIEARKTKHYYHEFEDIYAALVSAIELIRLAEQCEEEKILASTPHELFRTYTGRYYLLDYQYRKFYSSYDKTSDKDILKTHIREIVERQYLHITQKIQMKWTDLITAQGRNTWGVELIESQEKFYTAHVDKIISRNDRDKVAVIISDAMRYEVAVELKENLNKNTNGTCELTSMAGCLPSYTKLGMAALLPHSRLEFQKDHILVDGMNSDGIENREKILTKTREESIALRFKDLRDLRRDDARERIRGKRVIYIYHNKIDDTGDNQPSEDEVFKAADETIQEIEDMVNRLVNSLNISNIIITADHGFLYTRDALEDIDVIDVSGFDKDRFISQNKRFIISNEKTDLLNTHRFLMDYVSDVQKPLYLYTPYADLRFKMAGGGRNFVHGGLSFQEIAIPVLLYNHKTLTDLDKKGIEYGKVGITLIGQTRKITNNPFKITIFQTENVTEKRGLLKCRIALYDNSGTRVSDEKVILADKTADDPKQRTMVITLTMDSKIKNGIYTLKAIDEDVKATFRDVLEIPVEVDILITDDF
ncbi:BREX-1 system phosphatase PglZ type A [Methanospirillum sp. J.3.6.1-F.2.7.3]|uniref:BREX-1 system phosphatase PglZ type A n=1 Tax=Methanospirillum purgamenti TaxID=2834276 RepID=A0A8E7AUM2_9EURY|nr:MULTISPECIES: BREX-1 system phosphatase PglZ type A [Methanospirillum]MDX8551721.1 BREX-1 system phosphatase PglZ type A [Methanospirillum hungatei]QVV87847.1 BREX-1 system phosphatase PglZ type A [Methanospirillum sp. J.3.6.1-F.2.7.3]